MRWSTNFVRSKSASNSVGEFCKWSENEEKNFYNKTNNKQYDKLKDDWTSFMATLTCVTTSNNHISFGVRNEKLIFLVVIFGEPFTWKSLRIFSKQKNLLVNGCDLFFAFDLATLSLSQPYDHGFDQRRIYMMKCINFLRFYFHLFVGWRVQKTTHAHNNIFNLVHRPIQLKRHQMQT